MEAGKIHEALVGIMCDCEAIQKGRKNQAQGFSFRGIDDVYNSLHPVFAKHRVYVRTEVVDRETMERPTKNGGVSFHHVVRVRFHLTHADGSSVAFETFGEAADSGDKGMGKTLSYALKSALFAGLLIPTEGDNDPDAHAHEFAPRPQPAGNGKPASPPPPPEKTPDPPHVRSLAVWMKEIGITDPDSAKALIWLGTGGEVSSGTELRLRADSAALCQAVRNAIDSSLAAGRKVTDLVASAKSEMADRIPY